MDQTRIDSLIEAIVNTFIGFLVTIVALPFVNKIIGVEMSGGQMSLSTTLFTIISILRGYIIRRFFNNMYWIKNLLKQLISKWRKEEVL
jgi:predicted Na+-dependent transporter